jgi:hypothetical protein
MTDESLAKGLTKRFIRELQVDNNAFQLLLAKELSQVSTLKRWTKFLERFDSEQCYPLVHWYVGGHKKNSYVCLSHLGVGDWNCHQGWDETLLFEKSYFFRFGERPIYMDVVSYHISHHAIQRLYQRKSDLLTTPGGTGKEDLVAELRFIKLTSMLTVHMKCFLIDHTNISIADEDIDILIPTTSGALFANYRNTTIEVRTYVSDEQLTKEQKEWKSIIKNICEIFNDSPMCYSNHIFSSAYNCNINNNHRELMLDLFLNAIVINRSEILHHMLSRCSEIVRYNLKKALPKAAKGFSVLTDTLTPESYCSMFETFKVHGARTVLNSTNRVLNQRCFN